MNLTAFAISFAVFWRGELWEVLIPRHYLLALSYMWGLFSPHKEGGAEEEAPSGGWGGDRERNGKQEMGTEGFG